MAFALVPLHNGRICCLVCILEPIRTYSFWFSENDMAKIPFYALGVHNLGE